MKKTIFTCLLFGVALPLSADIKVDTTVPKLPPPPSKETITLNPAITKQLTKAVGEVIVPPKEDHAGDTASAPSLRPMPDAPPSSTPVVPTVAPSQAAPAPATPLPEPAAPASPSTTSAAPATASTLTVGAATGDSLAQWYAAAEAYGTDAMPVRLIGLLQTLNPQKTPTSDPQAYTEALRCHRLALSGNTAAMRQLAEAFQSGTLAGLAFPQSMAASLYFSNRAQNNLPDLKPITVGQ